MSSAVYLCPMDQIPIPVHINEYLSNLRLICRTLQTLCSWADERRVDSRCTVPSLRKIQQLLVAAEDKESNFMGSRDWIGSVEVK